MWYVCDVLYAVLYVCVCCFEVVVVPYVVGAVVTVTVMHVCLLRDCEGARVTEMLVWGSGEVWLRSVRTWVLHVVQVFG